MLAVKCPLCNQDKTKLITKEGEFSIVECLVCGFVYVNPQPDEDYLKNHYQSYLPATEKEIVAWDKMMTQIFARSLKVITQVLPGRGRLLDIGSAHGFFLRDAIKSGFETCGLDLCQQAVDYSNAQGWQADCVSLFDKKFPDNSFDVVTMFYVLEHLPDPAKYLKGVKRILKPGGVLLLRVPHTTPLVKFLKLFGIANKLYDAPSHLNDFSPSTIKQMLENCGLSNALTFIGGTTYPAKALPKAVSVFSGILADIVYTLSAGNWLFPGVSKTTIAFKVK